MKTIKLHNGMETQVDDADYEELSKHKWQFHLGRYVRRSFVIKKKKTYVYMHRVILNAPKGMEVDHKDNNGLNNQRANLRLATHAQNNQNKTKVRGYIPYYGVCWDKSRQKYYAAIAVNKNQIHIGRFGSAVCAALAYDKKARELHGEFAQLNFKEPL